MLSIGKLTGGRASYYVEQLPGGADEYYTRGGTETPAVWLGCASAALGLSGRVDPTSFGRVLAALDPASGAPLGVPRTTSRRLAGFDLCFSAPKSVSVAWGLADRGVAEVIAAAHDRAVAETLEVLESEVVRARRGKRAATLVETAGVLAAGFGHRSSRAGDPQLHTHVVVANLTVDGDGRWSALAGDRVYRWAKTLGYVYQASLRAGLVEALGVRFGPVRNGAADIAGVDPALLAVFSTRRAQIVAGMAAAGVSSRAGAEVAALATRVGKDRTVSLDELRSRWASTAASLAVDPPAFGRAGRVPGDRVLEITAGMLAPDGLTGGSSVFDGRHVMQALAAGHVDGVHAARVVAAARQFVARPEVVFVRDGRATGPVFSTVDLLEVEAGLVAGAARRVNAGAGTVPASTLAGVLESRRSLHAEQKAMVEGLVTSGAGVQVVVGRAGSGKTFALDAARAAWEAAGYRVIGAALAARAAAELQAGSGIASTTVDRLLGELARPGPLSGLGPRAVLVVDEAGMVGTRKLAVLAAHAERAGAKLVLVGDPRQLPEIDAGGALSALSRAVPVVELAVNRRQSDEWERSALADLRSGAATSALAAYRRAGRVTVAESADAVREAMVDDWWQARNDPNITNVGAAGEEGVVVAAMYALRRGDVDDLNRRARARLDAAGFLGPERLEVAGRQFAVGDEVICGRNDRRLGVINGTRSTLSALDSAAGTVTLADGTVLDADYLQAGYLAHSYATTIHKAQGATVEEAFLLGSDAMYREAGYVGMSRGRRSNRLYVVAAGEEPTPAGTALAGPDPLAATIRLLGQSRAQTLAALQLSGPGMGGPASRAWRAVTLADPPDWLTGILGPPPVAAAARAAWVAQAERLAAYRDTFSDPPGTPAAVDIPRPPGAAGMSDTDSGTGSTAADSPVGVLGARPSDPRQARAYDMAVLGVTARAWERSVDLAPTAASDGGDGHHGIAKRSLYYDRGLGL